MLALKQALSLVTIKKVGGSWQPSNEKALKAWYKNQTGITLNGSDVSAWADSSSNSFDMLQATASEQPAYNSGDIDFDASATQSLQSASDINLSGAFTVGIKLEPDVSNVAVIGSNTTTNEFFKITSTTNLRFKTDGSQVDIGIDSGTLVAALDLVITRNASNLITLYIDGVAQADTETLAGTADINAIGVRATDANPYDGTISEIQVYTTESTALTANVSTYLSNI
tara:strand:- start:41 stop:721 length:681 start_codon:yes stop_codon:yes gene_type:complete